MDQFSSLGSCAGFAPPNVGVRAAHERLETLVASERRQTCLHEEPPQRRMAMESPIVSCSSWSSERAPAAL